MEYPLCDRTVTVYRLENGAVSRQVVHGCYLQMEDVLVTEDLGQRQRRKFLLVMPGDTLRVFPGDRVLAGEGPTVSAEQWVQFVPALVPELVQVGYVKPCYWQGRLCHAEAGE